MTPVFSAEDLRQFNDAGYVRLTSAFDPVAALRMQDYMWKYMVEKRGIRRDDPATWSIQPKLNKTTHHRIYDPILGERMRAGLDQLLGPNDWKPPKGWGGFLVTFPPKHPPDWTVTHVNWHWDGGPWDNYPRINGVFIFTFFSSVKPQGGGTLVATGTHRLLERYLQSLPDAKKYTHSKLRPKFWGSHPWLTALSHQSRVGEDRVAKFMGWATDIDGIPVRVVELTGEPGDAVMCHPCILHAASMNCSNIPRFMRVATVQRGRVEPVTSASPGRPV